MLDNLMEIVCVMYTGTVKINNVMKLNYVLVMTEFNYNLFFISKLVSCHNYELIFLKFCIIQDIRTKERISAVILIS